MVSQTATVDSHIDRERGLSECQDLSQLDIPQNEMDPQLEKEENFYSGHLNNDQLLETLTSYDTRILIRTEDELARSDGFSRIFPDKNCTRWPKSIFFTQRSLLIRL